MEQRNINKLGNSMKKIFLFFDYHITALGVQEETLNKI
jgi:hypothetical protein